MQRLPVIALALLAGLVAGAGGEDEPTPEPERIEAPGIENLFRLSQDLYSGGQPEGDDAFQALADLGIKTIVTVDGAAPDAESAARYGMSYVHLPVGYDGIPRDKAVALVKVLRTRPGPFYVHCHHGKHRGPAAAACAAVAKEGWGRDRARDWLERAGTSPDYAGLFASVAAFDPPTDAELADVPDSALTDRAVVPDLVEAMVAIDARSDHLKAIAAAGFRTPSDQPDLDPPHEALMLAELYRELRRLDESKGRGEDFLSRIIAAERHAMALRDTLRPAPGGTSIDPIAASDALDAVALDCKGCHDRFRD